MTSPLRILFMGSPAAAVPCLDYLHESEHELVAVVTQPDRPVGRGRHLTPCAVAARARELDLPLYQPDKLTQPPFSDTLKPLAIDLAIVVAYGKLLRPDILQAPRYGCWNVHFSLLPKYRGAAPCQWALINGEAETGISIIRLVEALDAGPILNQARTPIDANETAGELLTRLAAQSPALLAKTLKELQMDRLNETVQDDAAASLAPILKKEDGHLDWTQNALQLKNRIRGLNPWPGAYSYLPHEIGSAPSHRGPSVDKIRLKIYSAQTVTSPGPEANKASPGTILQADIKAGLWVACGDGALQIDELQSPGKKRMRAADFLRGHPLNEESQLL